MQNRKIVPEVVNWIEFDKDESLVNYKGFWWWFNSFFSGLEDQWLGTAISIGARWVSAPLTSHLSTDKDSISEMCFVWNTRQQTKFRNQEILNKCLSFINSNEFLERSVTTRQLPCTLLFVFWAGISCKEHPFSWVLNANY